MSDQVCPKCPPPGLPGWMGTFADLMSLLMCFFVLLLAFSEMDVLKFKQIAYSMKYAFGVQNKIEAKDIPKGTSVIAMEFKPGRPDPTPIDEIQQHTMELTQPTLEFQAGEEDTSGGKQNQDGNQRGGQAQNTATESSAAASVASAEDEQINQQMKKVAEQLQKEILDGAVELESLGQQLIIRIREQGSFSAGSAFLQPQFKPIIRRIATALSDIPGEVVVSGHSDNQRISNELYRSNWELSVQRAVAVAEELRRVPEFDENRMMIVGRGSTQPLAENDNPQNRGRNRRVEITVMQGKAKEGNPINLLP
ncbi:flagellar motor protein MotB [Pseudobowmanella zhangzhouensis]|uniref:flagellar motor protein MotB n=1 Tax=Pseudobowmanella zhangzhouensis TaxID=1537679 RepID=UPI00361EF7FB